MNAQEQSYAEASANEFSACRQRPESPTELRSALARGTKSVLVQVLLELAHADRGVLRQLTARLDVAAAED